MLLSRNMLRSIGGTKGGRTATLTGRNQKGYPMQSHFARPRLTTKIFRMNIAFDTMTRPGTMLEIVMIAYNEKHARNQASCQCGIEGPEIWHDRNGTQCTEVGRPHRGHHYPQVLAKYIQTPYRSNDIGASIIEGETSTGAIPALDDGTGALFTDPATDGQGDDSEPERELLQEA